MQEVLERLSYKTNASVRAAWQKGRTEYRQRYPIALYPTYIHPRMAAQRSCFTIHGRKSAPLVRALPHRFLRPFDIDTSKRIRMLRDLRVVGVSKSSLFPEFVGLADDLENRFLRHDRVLSGSLAQAQPLLRGCSSARESSRYRTCLDPLRYRSSQIQHRPLGPRCLAGESPRSFSENRCWSDSGRYAPAKENESAECPAIGPPHVLVRGLRPSAPSAPGSVAYCSRKRWPLSPTGS